MQPTVVISHRGEARVRAAHPWIYRTDVVEARAAGGDTVRVVGPRERLVGQALYSDKSEIALRMLTRGSERADVALWLARIESSIAYRAQLDIDATAYRLVHAEADLLPSLVVDRYGDYLVMQTLSQGADRLLAQIRDLLVGRFAPAGMLARNDQRVRQLEGLESRVEVLYGSVPDTVMVREGRVEYDVDLWKGQKTGLFLDQRENRQAAVRYARGRLLDCFSYQGGFALQLAPRCSEVLAIDISEQAVAQLDRNMRRNSLANIQTRVANVFDELRLLEREGRRFEMIVLDPPAFAKNKASVPKATAGYKEINLRALKLLAAGGHLVTCSCSYHVDEAAFGEIVYEASADAHVPVMVVEKRMQSRDHPVLLGVPETYYLKCFILRRIP